MTDFATIPKSTVTIRSYGTETLFQSLVDRDEHLEHELDELEGTVDNIRDFLYVIGSVTTDIDLEYTNNSESNVVVEYTMRADSGSSGEVSGMVILPSGSTASIYMPSYSYDLVLLVDGTVQNEVDASTALNVDGWLTLYTLVEL